MIAQTHSPSSVFSSEVQLRLELDGQSYPVSSVGPDRLVLVEPQAWNSRSATLIITIDGESRTCPIQLSACFQPSREHGYTRR